MVGSLAVQHRKAKTGSKSQSARASTSGLAEAASAKAFPKLSYTRSGQKSHLANGPQDTTWAPGLTDAESYVIEKHIYIAIWLAQTLGNTHRYSSTGVPIHGPVARICI
ncbi:uncharacterized protein LDX57_007762 [Aspergillus melleus]|uniref:uncharacterized protein n=1 Tax=Aspergillus melleus TaxID=138277 RepID=UPI001E8E359D|nr:uncharacterized protein LDX57_007762 [Aspergillus melleus]KAH8430092.1 hypothetical protein LDX57_007762 [Aspergillus melleus]